MAIYGALGEGFTQSYGTRPGEYLSRGTAIGYRNGDDHRSPADSHGHYCDGDD